MARALTLSAGGLLPQTAKDEAAWPTFAVLAVLWLLACNQLRVEWSTNPQYAYGWTVPFLALYLFGERWRLRPVAAAVRFPFLLALGAAPFVIALLPLRLIQEAAPDWRSIHWAMGAACVGASLAAVCYAGGWPWLRHFLFPICFLLIAIPWPVPLEQNLVQSLMRGVAALCVELLSWLAIPALRHGNIIEVGTGSVGVEEACSGVRSLQTTMMAALFLGELFRCQLSRRLLLLGCGMALAFVCNLGRTFTLVMLTVNAGPAAVGKWHDMVGMAVLIISVAGLAGLCALLRGQAGGSCASEDERAAVPGGRPLPRAIVLALAGWFLCIEVATEAWYRTHEARASVAEHWSLAWPTGVPGFREIAIPESTRAMLRCNEGRSAAWPGPDGSQWSMVSLRWAAGRASSELARSHGPEICLASIGATLQADQGVKSIPIRGLEFPIHSYVFSARGAPWYVFYCLWEDQPIDDAPKSTQRDMTVASRLNNVFKGRRNAGQQVVEIAVAGLPGPVEAETEAIHLLDGLIRRQ